MNQRLTTTEVVALLQPLISRPGEATRGADQRVRGALRYALKQGRLPKRKKVPGLEGQEFLLGEVIALARENRSWGLMELGWAARYPAAICESIGVEFRATDAAEATVIPGDRARMVEMVEEQQRLIREKDAEILRLRERISGLEPLANRFERVRAAGGKRGSWNDDDDPGV